MRELGPAEPVTEPDHVLIVKHDEGQVRGERHRRRRQAGCKLPDSIAVRGLGGCNRFCAQSFAEAHGLQIIYVKGFRAGAEV